MQKKIYPLLLIFTLAVVSSGFKDFYNVGKISARMITRSAKKGTASIVKADIFYQASGKMITHFLEPTEYFMVNTAKGEVSIYDPRANTVNQQLNYMYSTETSQLYYFLQNKKADLGLKVMGFTVNNTRFEEDLMITRWNVPVHMAKFMKEVELVHKGPNPIYMRYVNKDGSNSKKMYYYNYVNLNGTDFPQAITQVDYLGKDSVVTKTTYTDIRINEMANSTMFNYTIPPTARIIN